MLILWIIAGMILGWISIEVLAVMLEMRMPILFNLGMTFVGGLTAYTIITYGGC